MTYADAAPIAVYGATGYTGSRIAAELVRRGARVVLVGRRADALRQVAASLPAPAEVRVARLDDPTGLRAAFAGAGVVVNAAGPYSETCRPVVSAAVDAGVHYLDIAGEQNTVRAVLEEYDAPARQAGVALLPSFAFYAALADLLAAAAAAGMPKLDEVHVVHRVTRWTPSGAALRNRLDGMRLTWFEYEDGALVPASRSARMRTTVFDFPPPAGRRRVAFYPAPEIVTIPRHVDARRVTASMTTATMTAESLGAALPLMSAAARWLLRTPARPLVERVLGATWRASTDRLPDDPTTFLMVVCLRAGDRERRAWASGRGIFDATAPIAAEGALRLLAPGFDRTGALAASEAFEPREVLVALAEHGIAHALPAPPAVDAAPGRRARAGSSA